MTATSFIKVNGTSSQFLKADGSVDSGTYITSADGGNADQLDGEEGTYYLDYGNFTNTPTIPSNTNQLTNGAGFITSADGGNADQLDGEEGTYYLNYNNFTNKPTIPSNTNQLTNGAGFITGSSSGTELTGIVTSIIAGNNITISGSTGEVTINSSGGGNSGYANTAGIATVAQGLTGTPDITVDDITAGSVNVSGIVTATNIVSVKSDDGTSGRVDLYCESNNAHYARLQAPDHGDFSGNPTIKLPSSSGTLLLNNGSGANLTSLTGASAATYGDSGSTPVIVVDANGRITGISTASISGGGSYTDSDVDTHLNVSGASSGHILSWNGSDYAWVADQTGGGGGTTQNLFETIAVSGQSDIVADSATDTLTLVAGSNMTITTNASGDSITFSSSGGGGGGGGGVTTGKAIAMAMVFG